MKIARQPGDLRIIFAEASAEAHAAFGDSRLQMAFIPLPVVEIQILGISTDTLCTWGTRLFPAAPLSENVRRSPLRPRPDLGEEMGKAARPLAHRIQYENAGTIEFILDPEEKKFYFMK
jgi:acetyl-CoA carboxylase biotin carboxylase subunit